MEMQNILPCNILLEEGVPKCQNVIKYPSFFYIKDYYKLIDWKEFYALSALFQPCNCGKEGKEKHILTCFFLYPILFFNLIFEIK